MYFVYTKDCCVLSRCCYVSVWCISTHQMLHNLVQNGANNIWEHELYNTSSKSSSHPPKPNPADKLRYCIDWNTGALENPSARKCRVRVAPNGSKQWTIWNLGKEFHVSKSDWTTASRLKIVGGKRVWFSDIKNTKIIMGGTKSPVRGTKKIENQKKCHGRKRSL